MATYTGSEAITVTLVANQVDTITLTGAGTELRISQTSTTPIYIITAQPGQTPATPTVAGAGTTAIMTNYPVVLPWTGSGIVIKVISAGTGTVNFALTTSKFAPQDTSDLLLGTYTSYTPTFTAGLTIGNGTVTGAYCRVNGFVHVWGRAVLGSTSSITGAVNLTVPVSIDATVSGNFLGTYIGQVGIRDDSAATTYSGVVQTLGTAGFPTRVALQVQNASGTYLTGAALSATVPMTWAVNDTLWWNMYYEAA